MPKQKPTPIFLTPAEIDSLIAILTQWTRQVADAKAKGALIALVKAKDNLNA